MWRLLILLFVPALAFAQPVEVIRVVDGDTFIGRYYLVDHQEAQKGLYMTLEAVSYIRVIGVDTPEIHGKCPHEKDLALKAKAFTKDFLKDAQIYNMKADRYPGRVDAIVESNGENLAAALIDAGLGRVYNGKRKREGWCE